MCRYGDLHSNSSLPTLFSPISAESRIIRCGLKSSLSALDKLDPHPTDPHPTPRVRKAHSAPSWTSSPASILPLPTPQRCKLV